MSRCFPSCFGPAQVTRLTILLVCLKLPIANAQGNLTLGTTSLAFSSASGMGSVVVGASGAQPVPWTASTTSDWLHIAPDSQTCAGSGLVKFTYDANPGSTRTGTIDFNNGQVSLTLTQADADYLATSEMTTLLSGVLTSPALDGSGNVYFADVYAGLIMKWTAATGNVTTLVSKGLRHPASVAVDKFGQFVYISDTGHNAIQRWTAATGQLSTVVYSLNQPNDIALDLNLNIYIADTGNNALEKWIAATGQLVTLASSLNQPAHIALDPNGNVYIADTGNNAIEEWTATTGQVTTVLSIKAPGAIAFEEPFFLDIVSNGIKQWIMKTGQLETITGEGLGFTPVGVGAAFGHLADTWYSDRVRSNGFLGDAIDLLDASGNTIYTSPSPIGAVAVDSSGDVYFSGPGGPMLLPSVRKWDAQSALLSTIFSAQFTSINGVAVDTGRNLYFTQGSQRAGDQLGWITEWSALTQQTSLVTNDAPNAPNVYPQDLVVGPNGDVYFTDSSVSPYDSNDAVKKWTAATGQLTTLVPGLTSPQGIALDVAGNIYFSQTVSPYNAIAEWNASTGDTSTLITGSNVPKGASLDPAVAVDGAGDVYFSSGGAIEKQSAATDELSILATPILGSDGAFSRDGPIGSQAFALDSLNNIYTITYGDIKKLTRAFIGPAAIVEPLSAGSDQLLPVLPSGTPLNAVSDQPWLTITGQDNDVVRFSFTAASTQRTAHINVLGQSIPITQANTSLPTVVSYSVLWGSQAYNLTESTRNRLPWQISGIRVVFSDPVTTGDANSLGGITATALTGLGTNTLTWTIDPVASGSFTLTLAAAGPDALTDSGGNPVAGETTRILKVLLGDTNDDGVVNASDLAFVTLQKQYSNNLFADLNGDGVVDANDVIIVRDQIGSTLP